MAYYIGLDFGTTATKIAYLDSQGQLQTFRSPHPTGTVSLPSAVRYPITKRRSANSALPAGLCLANDEENDTLVYEHFKAFLPFASSTQWQAQGWRGELSPEEVTRGYFRQLLFDHRHSFTQEVGPIAHVVLALPHPWLTTPTHRSLQVLQRIFSHDLGVATIEFRSDVVCALTYITHCYQQRHQQSLSGTVFVCSAGGSGLHMALCRVYEQHIEVLADEGEEKEGVGCAGIAFDQAAATTAYSAVHGVPPAPHGSDFRTLVRAFSTTKAREHQSLLQLLTLQQTTPTLSDTPIYIFASNYTLDVTQLQQSFASIAAQIGTIASRLLSRTAREKWRIDHVVLVGEFSQFPLVRSSLFKHLSSRIPEVRVDDLLPCGAERAAVSAYGAALLTQEQPCKPEPYAHTIGIFTHRRAGGRMIESFLPFVEAGTVSLVDTKEYFLCDADKKPVTIHVAQRSRACLPLYVRWRGIGEPHAVAQPEVDYPSPGAYHLALVFDRTRQASLLCKSVVSGETTTYAVGPLRFDLLAED